MTLSARIYQTPILTFNKLRSLLEQVLGWVNPKPSVKDSVKYSYEKYHKTYELLEKYDREASEKPETLADAGRLHPFISKLQKEPGKHGGAHSAN